jgi:hypothetical protein
MRWEMELGYRKISEEEVDGWTVRPESREGSSVVGNSSELLRHFGLCL